MDEPITYNTEKPKKQPKPYTDKRLFVHTISSLVISIAINVLTLFIALLGLASIFLLDNEIKTTILIFQVSQYVALAVALYFLITFYFQFFKREEKNKNSRIAFVISVISAIFLAFFILSLIFVYVTALISSIT